MKDYTNKRKQPNPVRRTIFAILIVLALFGLLFFMYQQTKVKLYDDPAITGNTSGNLLNGGFFAQSGNKIYFANPYDNNTLYSMNMDLKNFKQISKDNVSYLNVAGDYIFYTRRNDKKKKDGDAILSLSTTGLYRITTKGTSLFQLFRDPTQMVNQLGNTLYYQHFDQKKGLQLFRIGIDGKKDTLLLDEGASPTTILDDTLYYTGIKSDHNIHAISTDGSSSRIALEGNYTSLSSHDTSLYFMDMNNGYSLCQSAPDGSGLTMLIQQRISTYNISEDGETIYYQLDNGTDNGLYALNRNTGVQKLLRAGNYNFYHIISNYLFFEEFDGSAAYVMDTTNEQIQNFQPEKK